MKGNFSNPIACSSPSPTFPLHPHGQALLIAAVLAAVALALVDEAVLVIPAGVDQILPDRPLEETFAALTAVHPIVLPWGGKGAAGQAAVCPSFQRGGAQTNPKVKTCGASPQQQ